jgi:hypothetical protein
MIKIIVTQWRENVNIKLANHSNNYDAPSFRTHATRRAAATRAHHLTTGREQDSRFFVHNCLRQDANRVSSHDGCPGHGLAFQDAHRVAGLEPSLLSIEVTDQIEQTVTVHIFSMWIAERQTLFEDFAPPKISDPSSD